MLLQPTVRFGWLEETKVGQPNAQFNDEAALEAPNYGLCWQEHLVQLFVIKTRSSLVPFGENYLVYMGLSSILALLIIHKLMGRVRWWIEFWNSNWDVLFRKARLCGLNGFLGLSIVTTQVISPLLKCRLLKQCTIFHHLHCWIMSQVQLFLKKLMPPCDQEINYQENHALVWRKLNYAWSNDMTFDTGMLSLRRANKFIWSCNRTGRYLAGLFGFLNYQLSIMVIFRSLRKLGQ